MINFKIYKMKIVKKFTKIKMFIKMIIKKIYNKYILMNF